MKRIVLIIVKILIILLLLVGVLFAVRLLLSSREVKQPETEATQVAEVNENEPTLLDDFIVGDVVKLFDLCFQVNGIVTEVYTPSYGYATYHCISDETGEDEAVTIEAVEADCVTLELNDAIVAYQHGEPGDLLPYTNIKSEQLECFGYESYDGYVPIIHDLESDVYTMVVPMETNSYMQVTSKRDFRLVNESPTAVYTDPGTHAMTDYTYSTYEISAINNTKSAILGDAFLPEVAESVDVSTEVESGKYTSMPDQYIREAMLKYETYKWEKDGTTKDSTDILDISSAATLASQWTLSESSSYSWVNCGLKLSGLSGVKSNDGFAIKGTVTNMLNNDRPWVLVIKYIDGSGNLLGVRCVDRTTDTIAPFEDTTFTHTVPADKEVDVNAIKAVQFEIY